MQENIREIVKVQLLDLDIEPEDIHFRAAEEYYEMFGTLPDIDYLLAITLESSTEELDETDSDDDHPWIYNNAYIARQAVYHTNNVFIPPDLLDVKIVAKDINEIPLSMFKNVRAINTECFICYDAFVDTDIVRTLPCNHIFHRRCVDNYLKNVSYLCPYCKHGSTKLTHTI